MPVLRRDPDIPDKVLRERLKSLSEAEDEYWAFRGNSKRGHAHAFFQYPAMMVPQMQGALIRAVAEARPALTSAFDPFVGSGTTLTESMLQGLRFTGWDINPLAALLCFAKSGPFYPGALKQKLEELMRRVSADRSTLLETRLENVTKWFHRQVSVQLSRLRRAIRDEPARWARCFFWVALADAVRLSSNSRTSTFKLHIRPQEELVTKRLSPVELFKEAAERNISHLQTQHEMLKERGLVEKGRYRKEIEIKLWDATKPTPRSSVAAGHDLLISSPPYGDNKSTVPYGQYSYLPLSWIDGTDIMDNWDEGWLKTTHEIDTRSLGGVLQGDAEAAASLRALSQAFAVIEKALEPFPRDRLKRVTAFCTDLNRSLGPVLSQLREGAYLIWTVGNRHVGGARVPLDAILSDLLMARGCQRVADISRPILLKRMAVKNSISDTMRTESVLVFRK
ncbi:MAG TPA: hypothetical protein VKA46_06650 [Gemmataceae bacterium]|nr:hypothetical protein [Gemmataceae bacterium]